MSAVIDASFSEETKEQGGLEAGRSVGFAAEVVEDDMGPDLKSAASSKSNLVMQSQGMVEWVGGWVGGLCGWMV